MADSVVNVSGYDASYGIDAFLVHSTPTTSDYRQVVSIGGDSSGAGSTATVTGGSLTTSSHDATVYTKLTEIDTAIDTIDGVLDNILTKNTEIDAVLDNSLTKQTEIDTAIDTIDGVLDNILTKNTEIDAVLDNSLTKQTEIDTAIDTIDGVLDNILTKNTEIDAVLDTIKVDTEAIETATEAIQAASGNFLSLSTVFVDEDASADNPQTNTIVINAPGSGKRIVLHGYSLTVGTAGASDYGLFLFTDDDVGSPTTGATNIKIASRPATTVPFVVSNDFTHGVPLTANTALKLTSTETSGQIFIYGVLYVTTESV